MSIATPFHSSKNSSVYHVCGNCKEGQSIQVAHKINGKGNGRLCQECERLQKSGKC